MSLVSHSIITLRWPLSIHVRKVILFYFNDQVIQFSRKGYQTEGISLWMYLKFFSTLRSLPCCVGVALRKRESGVVE